MTVIGDRTVCRVCNGVLRAVKDPTVISFTAGLWIHTGPFRRFRNHTPVPWNEERDDEL